MNGLLGHYGIDQLTSYQDYRIGDSELKHNYMDVHSSHYDVWCYRYLTLTLSELRRKSSSTLCYISHCDAYLYLLKIY